MDLKGFGLQFPKEYALDCMDVIQEYYPCEEAQEYRRSAAHMFERMSVKLDTGEFLVPKRGVGLGYFSNIMSIVIASILTKYDVVKMFNDDMLIPDDTYEDAKQDLIDHSFVINDKKSGHLWYKVPFFANVSLARNGALHYFEVQGMKSAIFTKRYHYERKSLFNACRWIYRWKQCFHYERIFGYEVHKGEAFDHPCMLGLNPKAPYPVGYVKGGMLRKYISPKQQVDEDQRRVWSIMFPWKNPRDHNFHNIRKEAIAKYKNSYWYTEYDEYLNPRIEAKIDIERVNPDYFLAGYQLPRWADYQSIIRHNVTCGRTTMGTNVRKAAHNMLSYLHSDNPIHSWITGGYKIISSFYRIPGVSNKTLELYTHLKRSYNRDSPMSYKTSKEDFKVLKQGSGLDFMKNIIESNDETVMTVSAEVEYSDESEYEPSLDLEGDDDEMVFEEDDQESISDDDIDNNEW